jgi:hypothetical protein
MRFEQLRPAGRNVAAARFERAIRGIFLFAVTAVAVVALRIYLLSSS